MDKKESTKDYIQRYKDKYRKIGDVYCVALGLKVKFTLVGFKHLIFKGSRRRVNSVIKNRLRLIPLAPYVLKKADEVVETRIRKENIYGGRRSVRYDAIEAVVGKSNVRVRVVVRTIGEDGQPHFYSIMKY